VGRALHVERFAQDRLGVVRLPQRHEAGALVVGHVEPPAVEVHAAPAIIEPGVIERIVGPVLGLSEGRRLTHAGVRSGLQGGKPGLGRRVRAPVCVALRSADQVERACRVAVVGRDQAPAAEDPAAKREVLGLIGRLERQLVPSVGTLLVAEVEGEPRPQPGEVPRDRAEAPPVLDGLGSLQQLGRRPQVLMDVGQQVHRRNLCIDLVEAQHPALHPVQRVAADVGRLHGSGEIHQLDAERLGQEHTAGAAEQPEEGTTLHAGIRRWTGRRGKPQR
jgi:hypothetical protein